MIITLLKDHPKFINEINSLTYKQWGYMTPDKTEADWLIELQNRCNDYELPTTVIAIKDDTLLGAAALVNHDMDTRMELSPWLAGVYVKKEYRKQGVGSKLVKEIERIAQELNIKTIYLFTPDKETFYKSLDWKTIEQTPYRSINAIIMKKDLE